MDNELEKRQKQRNDAIERLLFKVNQIASNSGKTFTYDIRLNTITGEEIIRLNDCDTESSTEEKRDKLRSDLDNNIKQFADCYSVTGTLGPRQPVKNRVQIREIIGYDLIGNGNEEDEETSYPPAPIPFRNEEKKQPRKNVVMDTNYSQATGEFFDLLGMILGGQDVSGLGSVENKRTALAMQIQEYKMKSDLQIERLNGNVSERDRKIAELEAKLAILEKDHDRMKAENERFKKTIENSRPKLEEYKRLKSKTGRIAEVAGTMVGTIVTTMAARSKYAPLLGLLEEDEPQEDQGEQEPSTETQESENILIEQGGTENEQV